MINKASFSRYTSVFLGFLVAVIALLSFANEGHTAELTPYSLGYLEIEGDQRYLAPRAYAGIEVRPRHRPYDGAAIAIRGAKFTGRALGLELTLQRASAKTAEELIRALKAMHENQGTTMFLVDASSDVLSALSKATQGLDILLFNITEQDDSLRADHCAANLMHTIPSHAMVNDAMAQFLVSNRWKEILVLKGEFPEDAVLADAFLASAKKYGLSIAEVRDFVLGSDPRERHKNNITLLTSGVDYDAVFVADSVGQVGRYIPYQTALPRPVVGSEGLVAGAWHWAWERHGAPQLNQRFERKIDRYMGDKDWAAWAAIKTIVGALSRAKTTEFSTLRLNLKSPEMIVDGYKGTPMSFRAWDNQLRQPILIHSYNAVMANAPITGFLHRTQYMDTLGYDAAEKRCQF